MRRSLLHSGLALAVLLGTFAGAGTVSAQTVDPEVTLDPVGISVELPACTELEGQSITAADDDGTPVTATVMTAVATTDGTACSISGQIEGRIGYTIELPLANWNGRYFQVGCGGFCGNIPIAQAADVRALGFAVAAEDSGHSDPTGGAEWALNNPTAEIDWGYLSPHLLAVVAKQAVADFYGQAADHSYYRGGSTGGRQALSEAQRYPLDFDGVIAGAPALYQNYLATLSQGSFESANRRADGTAILTAESVGVLSAAVLASCDLDDARPDGVVGDPLGCSFDVSSIACATDGDTACLTPEEVGVVERIYSAPTTADGTPLYTAGLAVGSEAGLMGWSVGTDEAFSGSGNYAQNVLRYLAFEQDPGASYALADFDPGTQYPELAAKAEIYNADDPDLSDFESAGGKLVLFHGWADPLITPYGTIEYFESVVDTDGSAAVTDEYARLFLLPGVRHVTGGPGEDTVDWITPTVAWVEAGIAPATITATKQVDGVATSSRVVERFVSGSADARLTRWFGTAAANADEPGASPSPTSTAVSPAPVSPAPVSSAPVSSAPAPAGPRNSGADSPRALAATGADASLTATLAAVALAAIAAGALTLRHRRSRRATQG